MNDERSPSYSILDDAKFFEKQRAIKTTEKGQRRARVDAKIRALEESGEGVNIYDIRLMNEILTA